MEIKHVPKSCGYNPINCLHSMGNQGQQNQEKGEAVSCDNPQRSMEWPNWAGGFPNVNPRSARCFYTQPEDSDVHAV